MRALARRAINISRLETDLTSVSLFSSASVRLIVKIAVTLVVIHG